MQGLIVRWLHLPSPAQYLLVVHAVSRPRPRTELLPDKQDSKRTMMTNQSKHTAPTGTTPARRRLLRDLKEIEDAGDLHGIVAAPLEDDIFEWHANILFGDDPLHLRLHFSESYPSEPPRLICCTRLPHPNIQEPADGGWAVCLDLLEAIDPEKSRPYAGWSSGMTVLSILIQLQSFLADESMQYMTSDEWGMEEARRHMRRYDCGCGHMGERPWPAPLTPKARVATTKRLIEKVRLVVLSSCSLFLSLFRRDLSLALAFFSLSVPLFHTLVVHR